MLLLIVSLIPLTLAAHNSTKCYALASSGGGNNGAWEAGVVYGFAHQGDPSDYYWDSVTGVSAGAINSVLNCAWAPDDVVNFSEALSDLWAEMTTADLYVPWPGGFKEGITDQMGLWNDTPGLDFAHRLLANYTEFKKEITVAAVNVATGEYTTFNTSDTSFYDMQQATLCSASIPGVFPPQHFKGEYYMDGGTVWNINIVSAIEQCLNKGYAEEDVVLDMYICGFSNLTVEANGTNNGLQNWYRKRDLHSYYNGVNAIVENMIAYPKVEYREYVQQYFGTDGLDEINFSNSTTWPLQEDGRDTAQKCLETGECRANMQTLYEWSQRDRGDESRYYERFQEFVATNLIK